MAALEASVRGIEKDGLLWGKSKLVAVGFGIKKLQINLVIEDEKIGLDDLQQEIEEFEDYVQSTDIVSHSWIRISQVPITNHFPGCHAKVVDEWSGNAGDIDAPTEMTVMAFTSNEGYCSQRIMKMKTYDEDN